MTDDDEVASGGMAPSAPVHERTLVSQEEIDDVLRDERLSATEREARLTDLRQRILDDEHARDDEVHAPLQVQIMDALSMLAQGGHDYDGHLRIEGEPDVSGTEQEDTSSGPR